MKDIQRENLLPPGVISTNKLDLCMETIKARFAGEKKMNESLRFPFPFEYAEFKLLLAHSANVLLEHRRERQSFVFDEKMSWSFDKFIST